MPSRLQKQTLHHNWRVIFERAHGKRCMGQLKVLCNASVRVALTSSQGFTAELHWHSAVKWDNAVAWLTRELKVSQQSFGLQCGDFETLQWDNAPYPSTVVVQERLARESHVESTEAVSADLPASFLQVKLLQHFQRSDPAEVEPYERDYDI